MCNRKPLGRCVSTINKTRENLEDKERVIIEKIKNSKALNKTQLATLEQELATLELIKLKNEIDYYATPSYQEKYSKLNKEIDKKIQVNRVLGLTRKTWQDTFSKQLFNLEKSTSDQAESLYYAASSAKLMLDNLEYQLNAKTNIMKNLENSLKNPILNSNQKDEIQNKIRQLQYDIVITEMNISDTLSYLQDNDKKFNAAIKGKKLEEPKHLQLA